MKFVRSLVAGSIVATLLCIVITALTPRLDAPGVPESASLAVLREAVATRADMLEHLGVIGWISTEGWEQGRRTNVAYFRNKVGEDKQLRAAIETLDGNLARAAAMRDRMRFGVFISAVLAACAASVFRWFAANAQNGKARLNGFVLAGGILVAAVLIPAPAEGGLTEPWLPLAMSIVVVVVTIGAGVYAPRERERNAPGVGSPA
jgi:hypothetical protein